MFSLRWPNLAINSIIYLVFLIPKKQNKPSLIQINKRGKTIINKGQK